jgi:hypothetical protein
MARVSLALAILLAAAAVSLAADRAAVEQAYTDRLIAMRDTAAAHVEMARWCEANGLKDRALTHWREALALDPKNAAALEALAPAAAPAPAANPLPWAQEPATPEPADPTLYQRRQALFQEVREIDRTCLIPGNEKAWTEGRARLLVLRDPAAVEPIAQVLGGGSADHQKLACEALAGIPGDDARRELIKVLLTTPSKDVYLTAVEGLKGRTDPPDQGMLIRALGGQESARQRSAYALGELGAFSAIPALVDHLKVRRPKILEAPAIAGGGGGNGAYIAIGRAISYVRDAEPIVSADAVGWNPDIGTVMSGAVLSVRNVRVVGRRTIIEVIGPEPAVREALRKITGRDFGYDQAAWRQYLGSLKREQ